MYLLFGWIKHVSKISAWQAVNGVGEYYPLVASKTSDLAINFSRLASKLPKPASKY
jgi:hypothetical protein